MILELPYRSRKQEKQKKKHIKTLEKTDKEMKTNLPTTICLIDFFFLFFFWVSLRFYLIKYTIVFISFEGRTETSIEVLTSVCTVGCMHDFSQSNVQIVMFLLRVYRKRLSRGLRSSCRSLNLFTVANSNYQQGWLKGNHFVLLSTEAAP